MRNTANTEIDQKIEQFLGIAKSLPFDEKARSVNIMNSMISDVSISRNNETCDMSILFEVDTLAHESIKGMTFDQAIVDAGGFGKQNDSK